MSILNGTVSARRIGPEPMPYGSRMERLHRIATPSMAVAALDEHILVCGSDTGLTLYRICKDAPAQQLSTLSDVRSARQIGICSGFAYVSARDRGVYVCDLRDPTAPVLVRNLDTLELATGIAAGNGLLAVTNRHMGCELYDIRNPYQISRIGDFLCGEAQSVWLHGQYACIGDWINRQLRIYDLSDVRHPRECACSAVDGFADGVCVIQRGERLYCLTATGHHAAKLKNRRKYQNHTYVTAEMLADGYGCGHGIEIFDISDPCSPEWVAGLKTPPLFGGPDTWRVFSDGSSCVFTDSMNGIFTISLDDLTAPVFTGHYRLDALPQQRVSPPSVQVQTAAITDCAVVSGLLCAASDSDGVHILQPPVPLKAFLPPQPDFPVFPAQTVSAADVFHRSSGQIRNFITHGDRVYAAAGEAGIEVLDLHGRLLFTHPTPGICRDLCISRGMLFTAESDCGVACYAIDEGLREISRADGFGNVRQILPVGDNLAVQLGYARITRILLSSDGKIRQSGDICSLPMLYGRQLRPLRDSDRFLAIPLSAGATVLTASPDCKPLFSAGSYFCPFSDGACDCDGRLILIQDGGYVCLESPSSLAQPYTLRRIGSQVLSGTPYADGQTLILLNRCSGKIQFLDISNPDHPEFLGAANTGLHPESCGRIGDSLYAACGFDGIIGIDKLRAEALH